MLLTDRVLKLIRREDYKGRTELLTTTVAYVEQHFGHGVNK